MAKMGWTHPSVIDLVDVNTNPYRGESLSLAQNQAIALLRGTGSYKDNGSVKARFVVDKCRYTTLRSLRRKGLIDHLAAGQWYLTEAGENVLRGTWLQ
jgi:hypothetical protein